MTLLAALIDARARLTRALEAIHDGELLFATRVLEDLRDELALRIERELTR